ncbi:MAG: glycosyltransferase [Anaerolineaceae bacterium]|nr:MAG: glycosyltransferase [Anaerolineaceae bacterium]
MDKNPVVSIVTPSYNQGQFLEATILSVLNQDYPQVEYIIIDGQSDDDSPNIIRKYANRLAYWTSQPDQGQTDALAKGFAQASGNIIAWLNSDDVYLSSQVISDVVSLFQQYQQVDAVTGGGIAISKSGQWLRQNLPPSDRVHFGQLRYRNWLVQPATFFRCEIIQTLPLDHDLHYVFDWDFFIRLSKNYNILVVDKVWAGYRMWGQNKTARGDAMRVRELAEVTGRYLGTQSWQYWTLLFFYILYHSGEKILPNSSRKPFRFVLRELSRGLSRLSYKRFPLLY